MTVRADLDAAIELYHRAAEAFVRGDCEPYKAVFSHRDDVTLANPFGPIRQGWQEAATAMERATALYEEGEITGVENLQTYVTPELAYIIEIERIRAKMGGRPLRRFQRYFGGSGRLLGRPSSSRRRALAFATLAAVASPARAAAPGQRPRRVFQAPPPP